MAEMSEFQDGIFPTDRIDPVQALGSDQKKMVSPKYTTNWWELPTTK